MTVRARRIVVEVALTLGALAGVLCVVIAVVGVSFGMSPLVVRSGSMEPTIGVGDVAIARSVPANDARVGDIVSVTRPDGTRITHRVMTIDARVGNSTTMTLRGDANPAADAEPYTVTSVDRVAFHIPKLGYVLSWFATPYVWALASLVVLGLLWVAFRPDTRWRARAHGRHSRPDRRADAKALAIPAVAVAVVVASAVTGYIRTSGTLAALTDTATATGSVSAGRPIAPASLSCQTIGVLGGSARLSWPNPGQGSDYQLTFTPSSGATPRSSTVAATTTNPVQVSVSNSYITNLFGLTLLGSFTVELRSKVGNFTSGGRLTITITVALGGVSCGSTTGTSTAAPAPLAAARQAAPTTTTTTPPATSTMTAPPSTTSTPVLSGTPSPEGSYIASATGGVVVIRNAASGAEEYRGSGSTVAWTGPSSLSVTAADGSTTELTRTSDGQWVVPAVVTTTPTTTSAPTTPTG